MLQLLPPHFLISNSNAIHSNSVSSTIVKLLIIVWKFLSVHVKKVDSQQNLFPSELTMHNSLL